MQLPHQASLPHLAPLLAALPGAVSGARGDGVLRVDASALQAYDSSTISLLLEARRQALAAGARFEVAGAPEPLRALAQLYGVDELLALPGASSSSTSP
jgi:phospholipid transport system transporter-binding protein